MQYDPLQIFFSFVYSLQDRRCSEKFKRAAHRETFFRSIIETFAGASVQRSHTDSSAVRSSIDRIRFAKSLVDPGVFAASNKSKAATIDDTRDGLPSPRRRLPGMWRKLFLQQSVFPRWSHG